MKSDRELVIQAFDEARAILAEHFEQGALPRNATTIHRLARVLDRPEVVAALERMKAGRGLRVLK